MKRWCGERFEEVGDEGGEVVRELGELEESLVGGRFEVREGEN